MKTIIIGAGLVGSQLARHLIEQKGDVVLVERDEETARHAANRLDCLVLHDQGNNLEPWRKRVWPRLTPWSA